MAVSLEQFVRNLVDSGLMTATDVAGARSAMPAEKLTPDDAQPFARELVARQLLTPFQAKEIYQGRPHALVFGNYVVQNKLGQGGMGMVFKAEHRRMKRVVALKVMSRQAMKSPDAVRRFRREVEAAARLSHPNIVEAFDADEANGTHFLVMEYVPGSDLASLVKTKGPLPVPQAVDCIIQAARGLEQAHAAGVIHRDIKPANLLLDSHGTVKVLDMGLARLDESLTGPGGGGGALTQSGSIMGTVDYMSPEQAVNTKHADRRADIYSLGCSLYFLLAGRATYAGETLMAKLLAHRGDPIPSLRAARPEVPEALDAVFRRMIAKNADDRQQSMGEVIRDLQGALAGGAPAETPSVLTLGALQPDDLAYREFLAAIAPSEGGTALRTQTSTAAAAETLGTQPGDRTQSAIVKVLRKHSQRLSPRQWMLAGGVAAATALLALGFAGWSGSNRPDQTADAGPDDTPSVPTGVAASGPAENGVKSVRVRAVDGDGRASVETDIAPGADVTPDQSANADAPTATTPKTKVRPRDGWQEVLPWIDTSRDAVSGTWSLQDGILTGAHDRSSPLAARLALPIRPAEDYDLALTIRRTAGNDALSVALPLGGRCVTFLLAGYPRPDGDTSTGLQLIDGQRLYVRDDAVHGLTLEQGRGYRLVLTVRRNDPNVTVAARLDDRDIFQWTGALARLSPRIIHELPDMSLLGLTIFGSAYSVQDIEFLAVRGDAEVVHPQFHPVHPRRPRLTAAPLAAEAARAAQDQWAGFLGVPVESTNSLGMRLRLVPPGEFLMGSSEAEIEALLQGDAAHVAPWHATQRPQVTRRNEGPQHQVRISRPFLCGAAEVTVAQFRQFVEAANYVTEQERERRQGDNAQSFRIPATVNWRSPGFAQTDEHPVVCVNWNDAQAFCRWLREREGRHYRLPTEAEWEYACRAGTVGRHHVADEETLKTLGNFADQALTAAVNFNQQPSLAAPWEDGHAQTAPVMSFQPNPFGLFDFYGNVWEWCADVGDPDEYSRSPFVDPQGPSAGPQRIMRGGGFFEREWTGRSAFRNSEPPEHVNVHIGFRVVCDAPPEPEPPATPETTLAVNSPDRQAAEKVLALGGVATVQGRANTSWVDVRPGQPLPAEEFSLVRAAFPRDAALSGAELSVLSGLAQLVEVNLSFTRSDPSVIPQLVAVRSLQVLKARASGLRTSALAGLAGLPVLHTLDVGVRMIDDDYAFVGQLPGLRRLTIAGQPLVSPERLGDFPQLRTIHWPGGDSVDAELVSRIQSKNPLLRVLVGQQQQLRAVGADPAQAAIQRLLERGVQLTGYGYGAYNPQPLMTDSLSASRPLVVQSVTIPADLELSEAERRLLTHFTDSCDRFVAPGLRQADAWCEELAEFDKMWSLSLPGSDLTDAGLRRLANNLSLKVLDVRGTQVTRPAVTELRRALPLCVITSDQ